jgi:hypothetical protein
VVWPVFLQSNELFRFDCSVNSNVAAIRFDASVSTVISSDQIIAPKYTLSSSSSQMTGQWPDENSSTV